MQRSKNSHVLVLDAGNALYASRGPALSSKGQVIIEAMNMMAYDAMTLGDQDLTLGAGVLQKRISEASFPVLSSNVTVQKTGKLFALPYVIKEIGGHKVGIIGLTAPRDPSMPAADGREAFGFQDPLETIRRYASEVAAKADIVILLSHVGLPLDQTISQQVPEIDIIIGGQSRNIVAPTRYNDKGAVIAQAGYRGEWIGLLQVEFDSQGNVLSFQGKSVELTDEYKDDPEMSAFVKRVKAKYPE